MSRAPWFGLPAADYRSGAASFVPYLPRSELAWGALGAGTRAGIGCKWPLRVEPVGVAPKARTARYGGTPLAQGATALCGLAGLDGTETPASRQGQPYETFRI